MLLEPPIDDLLKKFGSPYRLAIVVGKRAKFLSQSLSDEEKEVKKEVSRAVDEAYAGKITSNH